MHRVYTEIAAVSQLNGMLLPQIMDFHSAGQHFGQCIQGKAGCIHAFPPAFTHSANLDK